MWWNVRMCVTDFPSLAGSIMWGHLWLSWEWMTVLYGAPSGREWGKSRCINSPLEGKPTHSLCSHIFYNILKYSKYNLEIEATVYKTFPAEIIDGPASALFFSSRQVHFCIKQKIKKTKKSLHCFVLRYLLSPMKAPAVCISYLL